MSNLLKEIPFKQGSTSAMLSAVCALFMFLTFLSYSFYHLFLPPQSLEKAAQTPGYVLVLPDSNSGSQAHRNTMGFLDHMLSYVDDVIGHKEFTMKDYSSILPLFMEEETNTVYVEIRLAHKAQLNETQFRQDIEGIIPGIEIYKRGPFFAEWLAKLDSISQASRSIAIMMFFALCACVIVLVTGCFNIHHDTIQTLRFLGASQGYITKKFQNFFSWRFLMGSGIGLLVALLVFVPFAWVLDPSLKMGLLFVRETTRLFIMAASGYLLLLLLMRLILSLQTRRLA
ncbi:MAG TPA: hypothetical protein DD412_01500 [Holosporales bacterium]|nr:hypothetical protein [Holosporales bacterium]